MHKFKIKYFDGENAFATNAFIKVDQHNLIILDASENQIDIWDKKFVKIDPNHLDGKFLLNTIEARARIEIIEDDFFNLCPEFKKKSAFTNKNSLYAIILSVILILTVGFYSLDSIANFIVNKIPVSAEEKITEKMSIDKYFEICSTADQKKFHVLLKDFIENKKISKSEIENIKIIKMPISNAFAVPGKNIYVTEKLIQQANSYDEIFGVIGHELGHSSERHPLKAIVRSSFITLFVAALSGDFSAFLIDPSTLAGLANLKFDRSLETAADVYAVSWLKKIGLSNKGLIDFFERNLASNKDLEKIPDFLKTHPANQERIETIKKLMPESSEITKVNEEFKTFSCSN